MNPLESTSDFVRLDTTGCRRQNLSALERQNLSTLDKIRVVPNGRKCPALRRLFSLAYNGLL
jgi:hypothetical protein